MSIREFKRIDIRPGSTKFFYYLNNDFRKQMLKTTIGSITDESERTVPVDSPLTQALIPGLQIEVALHAVGAD